MASTNRKSSTKSARLTAKKSKDIRPSELKPVEEKPSRGTEASAGDSLLVPSHDYSYAQLEEYYGESEIKIEPVLSRTSLLLLDYRQFKAARTIQTAARGWFVRHMLAKQQRSAAIIQREWRRFYACRYYYRVLERTLQQRIEQHYFKAAQKIQAYWRGWWVRENLHDQFRLTRMQVYAAEDLLHCVAFKLHHLLRTHHIPGIYSLRNTHCLSKVEQLLAAISFKQHNYRVRLARAQRDAQITEAKTKFCNSTFQTRIPYAGPNFKGVCEPKCCDMYHEVDADRKMSKILSLYDRASKTDPRAARVKRTKAEKKLEKTLKRIEDSSNFCGDVIKSMKRWSILADNNVSVDPNVFRNPKNVENFLMEVQSIMSLIQGRCSCNVNSERLQEIIEQADK